MQFAKEIKKTKKSEFFSFGHLATLLYNATMQQQSFLTSGDISHRISTLAMFCYDVSLPWKCHDYIIEVKCVRWRLREGDEVKPDEHLTQNVSPYSGKWCVMGETYRCYAGLPFRLCLSKWKKAQFEMCNWNISPAESVYNLREENRQLRKAHQEVHVQLQDTRVRPWSSVGNVL